MPTYRYVARNAQGKIVDGSVEAPSQEVVIKMLRSQGLLVTSLSEERGKTAVGKRPRLSFARGRINLDDLIIFSRQLATMISAGLPLIESLDVLGEQLENPNLRKVVVEVRKDVEAGSTFTAALEKHPKVFSQLYVSMVRAGEASGMLDSIMNQLAAYLEKTGSLRRKVKSAMVYPAVVSIIAVLIVIFILIKVIPTFESIYRSFDAQLPLPTQIIVGLSQIIRKFWYVWLIALVIIGYVLKRYVNTPKGRLQFDTLKLNMPVFGDLFRKVAVAKFTRTLGTLVRSGVNILNALEIVAKTAGNVVVENAVNKTKNSIQQGETIAGPLAQTGVFPPMVTRMIDVGEKTGALEEMLNKISEFYEDQVDAAVAALTSMLEPIMIAVMGVIVGGIVIAMYLPVFNMVNVVAAK
ncbi:MAG: type II secretion system F family protein [bacterium]|nr:type II secretion system F family protein [bacterium]